MIFSTFSFKVSLVSLALAMEVTPRRMPVQEIISPKVLTSQEFTSYIEDVEKRASLDVLAAVTDLHQKFETYVNTAMHFRIAFAKNFSKNSLRNYHRAIAVDVILLDLWARSRTSHDLLDVIQMGWHDIRSQDIIRAGASAYEAACMMLTGSLGPFLSASEKEKA